jgi:hypothetical protein
MATMKTADLTGAELDYWVAKAEGLPCVLESYMTLPPRPIACWLLRENGRPCFADGPYEPSTKWKVGGPIIEHGRIAIELWEGEGERAWAARPEYCDEYAIDEGRIWGKTPLIAAMRVFVAATFGDETPQRET